MSSTGAYASTLSGYVLTGFSVIMTSLLAWTARALVKITADLRLLNHEVLPPGQPSLNDKVDEVRTQVQVLRVGGSDRLWQILHEARQTRDELRRRLPDDPG